ncbi:hypothetical protein HDV06_004387 [Boothiomyces sp. JEL0866]|nr:hypothetical protein HDV06_004387 [Boothiomyces sp. JEL0866]
MKVEDMHLNMNDKLFGGVIATLIDIGGSLAIAQKVKGPNVGVSTDMTMSFLSAAVKDDIVRIESTCHKSGKSLAFTKVDLFVKDRMIATGSHTKYVALPITEEMMEKYLEKWGK